MARGNAYLVIQKGRFDDPIPLKVADTYGWDETTFDEQNQPVTTRIHPTWQQVAERYESEFGQVIEVTYEGTKYNLLEMDLSFLDGQIEELLTLKKNKVFPRYRILTNREAKRFVKGNLTAADEVV